MKEHHRISNPGTSHANAENQSLNGAKDLSIQFKLSVGRTDDPLEDEADQVADKVMRKTDPNFIQRKCSHCEDEENKIQRKESGSEAEVTETVNERINATRGKGNGMDEQTKNFMETRFGADFNNINVHTDNNAAQLNRDLNAKAFTTGNDIYFNQNEYTPSSTEGQRLLAHELTHTIQQNGNVAKLQRKASSIRFMEDATLDDISEGKKVLKQGDKGPAVIKITQAISELGFYSLTLVDESFDPPLTTGIEKYQTAKSLTGKVAAGQMDQGTFKELDKDFQSGYGVEKSVIGKQKSADLLKGTDTLDTAERTEAEKVISTEPPVNPITGLPPKFEPFIAGKGKFEDRLKTAVDKEIVDEYDSMGKGKTADHADPKKIYDWKQIDVIATESQKAVDSVFGEYKKGPAMKGGTTIMDAFADKEAQLKAGGVAKEDASAEWRVEKILSGDSAVKALDKEHGAIHTRAAEKKIVDDVKKAMVSKYRKELIETHKGWPGYEAGGKVFIQLFKAATDEGNRHNMWDYFQTFIHEYIHSLEHPDHIAYRSGKDEQKGGFVLREGTTDYFTKIVWNSISITDALRAKIEGPFHDPAKKFMIQSLNTYDESENAERLAGVVGIRNVAAAFFLGKVELIGKK